MADRINDAGRGKGDAPDARQRIQETIRQLEEQRQAELRADLHKFEQEHPPKPFDINDYARPEAAEQAQWKDRGIVNVKVSDLPNPEGISGPGDFEKVPYEEMRAGLHKLELMKPYVEDGSRATSEAWRKFDQEEGLSYRDGYQKVYDAFYGDGAVRVGKIGDHYDIDKGRHRIYLAKEVGMREIPARVLERV